VVLAMGSTSPAPGTDLNGDGVVDHLDRDVIIANFGLGIS
jgi:hypothetical protein